jgi:hypothetical protein
MLQALHDYENAAGSQEVEFDDGQPEEQTQSQQQSQQGGNEDGEATQGSQGSDEGGDDPHSQSQGSNTAGASGESTSPSDEQQEHEQAEDLQGSSDDDRKADRGEGTGGQDDQQREDQSQGGNGTEYELSLENGKDTQTGNERNQRQEQLEQHRKEMAREALEEMKEQWEPISEQLQRAESTFGDLDLEDLTGGDNGYDLSHGVWQKAGWEQLDELRKKLENMKELRDLIRRYDLSALQFQGYKNDLKHLRLAATACSCSLGRGSGMGKLQRAPRQERKPRKPSGVIRSESEPTETRGLSRRCAYAARE